MARSGLARRGFASATSHCERYSFFAFSPRHASIVSPAPPMPTIAAIISGSGGCTVCFFSAIVLLRRQRSHGGGGPPAMFANAPLDLGPEVAQEALHRPRRAFAEGADGVAFDLLRHLLQQIDFFRRGIAFAHAGDDAPHPAAAFAARRALAAGL